MPKKRHFMGAFYGGIFWAAVLEAILEAINCHSPKMPPLPKNVHL